MEAEKMDDSKTVWKPGNMLYPLPAVMVSCADASGRDNIMTAAWAGTVCSEPPCVSVSIRKERFSHDMIASSGEFVINLTTSELTRAMDFCGVRSGRDIDKWEACSLTRMEGACVKAPLIAQSPVNIECSVISVTELGSHDMFLGKIVSVAVDSKYIDPNGRFRFDKTNPIAYSHGAYYELGRKLGTFGYSVKKK